MAPQIVRCPQYGAGAPDVTGPVHSKQHLPPAQATSVLRRVLRDRGDFPALAREAGRGELTITHLVDARDLVGYNSQGLTGRAVWQAWAPHHALIRDAVTAVPT